MPRHNRPKRDEPRPLGGGVADQRQESGHDGDWLVRHIPGAQATKFYRCPGCDHEIRPGTPHVVVWPAEDYGSVEDRRHWHPGCWSARSRRRPTRRR
ncbi:hypothetical protein [Actinokineospora iranica]|uniref:hypothetical protein n=1 Tax=Actinokineospora iranica TaxID=1271860 RepID=UPI000B863F06